jgi:hypothetical protein
MFVRWRSCLLTGPAKSPKVLSSSMLPLTVVFPGCPCGISLVVSPGREKAVAETSSGEEKSVELVEEEVSVVSVAGCAELVVSLLLLSVLASAEPGWLVSLTTSLYKSILSILLVPVLGMMVYTIRTMRLNLLNPKPSGKSSITSSRQYRTTFSVLPLITKGFVLS